MLHYRERIIRVVIHGDDFTLLGYERDLDWFRGATVKQVDVTFRGRIGLGDTDDKDITLLNRVIESTSHGILYEADQRHADIIV